MPATDAAFYAPADGGLRVLIRVQPGASRPGIEGPVTLADGRSALKVRVSAPPEGGKANAAAVNLLAKAWGLPKSGFDIVAGHGARLKTLFVRGDPEDLKRQIEGGMV